MKSNKFMAKGLNMDELDQVSGGTVMEFAQICELICKVKIDGSGIFSAIQTAFEKGKPFMPLVNDGMVRDVKGILKNKFGIKAKISLGDFGTGICSRNNEYNDLITGKTLTHDQVLARIKNFA